MIWDLFKSGGSKNAMSPEEKKRLKKELSEEIERLRKKVEEMEYLEFKNRKRKVIKNFYTEAKKFCYGLLEEKRKELKNLK